MKYIIQPFLNKYGGAERKTYLLGKECKKRGINFQVITWKLNSDIYKEYDIQKYILVIKAPNISFWIIKSIIFILFKKKEKNIFAMNYPANIIAGICNILTLGKVKSIWMCNEVSAALNNNKRNLFKKILFTFGEFVSISFINTIFVNSKTTFISLKKTYNIKADKIIYSGIDTLYYDKVLNSINKKQNKEIDFIYVGRIERHKGVEIILEIALKNENKIFLIVGQGNYLKDLKRKAKNLKNISFIEGCDDIKKITLISKSKLLLFTPSNEPLGVVVMESLYIGTKVLAFNKGGPSEIIRKDVDGFLANTREEFIKIASNYKISDDKYNLSKSHIFKNFNQELMVSSMIEKWVI